MDIRFASGDCPAIPSASVRRLLSVTAFGRNPSLARSIRRKSWAQNLKPYSSPRVPHFSRVLCAREVGPWQWHTAQGHSRHAHFHLQYSPVVDPHRSHFAVRIRRKLLHFRSDARPSPSANKFESGIVCSYDVRLKQLPPRSVLHQCFTYVSPQAGDVSLLETMLQEFTAFERLPVTVTEADLLRDIQIHLPVNESDFLQSRRADSRSTQASTGSVF